MKKKYSSRDNTLFIVKKLGASKCVILCLKCIKTRNQASMKSKLFPRVHTLDPIKNGKGRKGTGREREG